jgi:flagellar biosynthesis/type III secretory pathway protein FliH
MTLTVTTGFDRLVASGSSRVTLEQGDPRQARAEEAARRRAVEECEERCRRELEGERARMRALVQNMERQFQAYLAAMEKQIASQSVDLAIKIAEAIVRHKMPDAEMIRGVMISVLKPFSDFRGVKVHLNPADAASFTGTRPAMADAVSAVELVADSSLGTGDVIIESLNGYFDARLGERLALMAEQLKERLDNKYANASGNGCPDAGHEP